MPPDMLLSLFTIAMASAWTPGPNNALVAASGVNFGLRRSLPHVAGIALGFSFMILMVGFFLGELFRQSLMLREALRWGGAALLLWVSWKIATAGGLGAGGGRARPFTFTEAAAFQWINPKAWVMALAISAQFVRAEAPMVSALWVALVFIAAGFTSAFGWAAAGLALRRWLGDPLRLRIFNITMGATIALGVVWLFVE
ncbi:LysE family translocator [Plastorhodobacter daqingensis]|uniref:LysE family translocator n=1 Tax=Plastorhodobacter daqingensis TaxID=1387281 RepID=A0ABW2UFA6_9RHOB